MTPLFEICIACHSFDHGRGCLVCGGRGFMETGLSMQQVEGGDLAVRRSRRKPIQTRTGKGERTFARRGGGDRAVRRSRRKPIQTRQRETEDMKIEKITVRAGRTVPHPLHSYGNIKTDLEIVAALDGGDDAETVRRQLQAKVENDVENHLAELRESIADMEEAHDRKRKMRRLETQLADTTAALDALKAAVENDADRPLLRPRYAGPKTAGETDPHEFPPLCDGTP